MSTLLITITAVLFGILAGIREGMVNIKPIDFMHEPYPDDTYKWQIENFSGLGLRGHRWHSQYHNIRVAVLVLFTGFILSALYTIGEQGIWSVTTVLGSLLLMWEFTEIGEAIGRQGKVIYRNNSGEAYEHVYLGDLWDKTVTGAWIYVIHAVRITIGAGLISLGYFV